MNISPFSFPPRVMAGFLFVTIINQEASVISGNDPSTRSNANAPVWKKMTLWHVSFLVWTTTLFRPFPSRVSKVFWNRIKFSSF